MENTVWFTFRLEAIDSSQPHPYRVRGEVVRSAGIFIYVERRRFPWSSRDSTRKTSNSSSATSRSSPSARCRSTKRLEWDRDDVCPTEVVRAMLSPELGLHLVFIPAEYDGMGGGAYDVYRLSCEFAKIDLGVATAMLAVALGTRSDPRRLHRTNRRRSG